ncbi:MAG: hypothetical protein GWP70_04080, partial [Proteobacteria bacterium]|nr:hypothetical protein [Pseudomonadota bacterium]
MQIQMYNTSASASASAANLDSPVILNRKHRGQTMKKISQHLALPLALLASLTLANAHADKVDAAAVTSFVAGTPAVAAEVNSTIAELTSAINDNDQRLASLLAMPDAPTAQALSIDCDADPEALNAAIASARRETSLDISVSGECNAVSINRDYVSIDGGPGGATIHSTAAQTPALRVSQARAVELKNLHLDGSGVAEVGLDITLGAVVEAANLTVTGATGDAIAAVLNSVLVLSGDTAVDVESAIGLYASGSSTVYISQGTTTVVTADCSVETELGGVLVSEGMLNLTGSCISIGSNSQAVIEGSSTITTGTMNVSGGSMILRGSAGNSVQVSHGDRVLISSGGSLFLAAADGGNVGLSAAADTNPSVVVAGNANIGFLLGSQGEGGGTSRVDFASNLVVLDGYLISSANSAGVFDGRIQLGSNANFLRAENSRIVTSGSNADNNISHLGFGLVNLSHGVNTILGSATTVDAATRF